MKKFVVCLVAFAFVAAIASVSFGRSMQDEAQAVRNYLDVVDAKLAKAKKANQSAKINLLHAEKNASLARWNKLKASMKAPVKPQPIYVEVPAAQEPVREGRGIAIYINGGLDKGLIGYAGNVDYDLSAQPDQGIKIRTGLTYISGTNPGSNDVMKAASFKLGAMYYISPYMPSIGIPLTWYVGAAALYPFKVNRGRTGRWGGEAYLGTNYSMAELGLINVELGYGVLKYSDDQPGLRGIDLKIGYGIVF